MTDPGSLKEDIVYSVKTLIQKYYFYFYFKVVWFGRDSISSLFEQSEREKKIYIVDSTLLTAKQN